jgi:hypothetical protein
MREIAEAMQHRVDDVVAACSTTGTIGGCAGDLPQQLLNAGQPGGQQVARGRIRMLHELDPSALREIAEAMQHRVDDVVAACSTTGTIGGCAAYIQESPPRGSPAAAAERGPAWRSAGRPWPDPDAPRARSVPAGPWLSPAPGIWGWPWPARARRTTCSSCASWTPAGPGIQGLDLGEHLGRMAVEQPGHAHQRGAAHGRLAPGGTVVESSSGNLGMALARACSAHDVQFVCVVGFTAPGISRSSC